MRMMIIISDLARHGNEGRKVMIFILMIETISHIMGLDKGVRDQTSRVIPQVDRVELISMICRRQIGNIASVPVEKITQ